MPHKKKKTYDAVTLHLARDGNKVTLRIGLNTVNYELNKIHPTLKAAQYCEGYEKVLALLNAIKNNPESQKFVSLYHKHTHEFFGKHSGRKFNSNTLFGLVKDGRAHEESLDSMIKFVEKQFEKASRHHYYCIPLGRRTVSPR